jgi:pimeloyl-ACP methyl ester carboxylesterase
MPKSIQELTLRSGDGLDLYARIYEGPDAGAASVLCLHGLMRNCRDFEDLAPHLQTRFRVIVPDLRGRGRSAWDPNPQNYQPTLYARDILLLLDACKAASAAIIGTSLGGMLAMILAATHRQRVAAIVLNDVGPEIDPTGAARIRQYAGRTPPARDWAEAIAQTRAVYGGAWPDLPAQRWPALARRGYHEDAAGVLHADADPMIGEAMRAAPAAALDLWPLWKTLGDVPMLDIRGASSDILSAATFARMKLEKPGLEQLLVPNRGHVPLLDEPECLAAIDGFLSRLK